jgi:N-terminal 7TM region of histidine kinase
MTEALLNELMRQINEAVTAATVIVAASLLMYNLTRGLRDRVTRSSAALLGCVTVIYVGDVFVSLSQTPETIANWLRLEWIGIAFAPTALFHLSDALLATTGMISRGRRRRIVRVLYLYSITFLIAATFTDLLVRGVIVKPVAMMQAGPLFPVYLAYFILATGFAFNNVLRARRRCLTTATHRRMTYLLFALVTPALGIFPFSLLFSQPSAAGSIALWLLINLGNIGIILMLVFMAYPLAFFGPNKPDRVIKTELLSFMLRGPVLGVAVLLVILFVPRLQGLGIPAVQLTPFFAVAAVLCLQWLYTYLMPYLERRLIYTDDQQEAKEIRTLSERLLTTADARQLLEAILASVCDYLRVPSAFVASFSTSGSRVEQKVGALQPAPSTLETTNFATVISTAQAAFAANGIGDVARAALISWQSYWIVPLYSTRGNGHAGQLIGVMGMWARSSQPDLLPEEQQAFDVLHQRTSRILDDMQLQQEVFASLEAVIEETARVQQVPDQLRRGYVPRMTQLTQAAGGMAESPEFVDAVKQALRDYWGGPRLTDERLLRLTLVTQAMQDNDNNPAKAVRAVLLKAIERLRPEGARSMTGTEWTLYNILDMRFVQGRKVRDVVMQLAMSEADLYRKQNIAIQRVADEISGMERSALSSPTAPLA